MRLVEIKGIKLEIDERTARTIDQYHVGDKVKVLVKSYSDTYDVHPGVIIGFSDFQSLPTIEIMYCNRDRWDAAECFKFAALNAASKDIEIAPFNELECILDKQSITQKMDAAIATKERELVDLRVKREYFITRFAQAFEGTTATQVKGSTTNA